MNLKTKIQQIIISSKQGFKDMKMVLEEGRAKLFLYPVIAIILLFLVYRYAAGALQTRDERIKGQIEAVHAQQNNQQEYIANKQKLLLLEPRFPDMSTKNAWLLNQVVAIFKDSPINPKVASSA